MAETVNLTIQGSNFALDSTSFTDTTYNTNDQTVILNKPGDIPYLNFTVTSTDNLDGPVTSLAITDAILAEFGLVSGEKAISDFAITDTSYNILNYWVYDGSNVLITDGSTNLTTGYSFRIQLKKRSDGTEYNISSGSPVSIQLTRYNSTDNKMTTGELSVTTNVEIDETDFTSYHPTGTWLSPVIDLSETPISMALSWSATESGETRLDINMSDPKQIEYRIDDAINPASNSIGAVSGYYLYPTDAMSSPGSWINTANGIDVPTKERYVQFRITFKR